MKVSAIDMVLTVAQFSLAVRTRHICKCGYYILVYHRFLFGLTMIVVDYIILECPVFIGV